MPWVKLDDNFFRNPKVVAAGRDARDLYLAGLCYCASGLTDGVIVSTALRRLGADAEIDDPKGAAASLVAAGLWMTCEGGFRVHDYLEYQPTAEKVKADRAAAAERMRKLRSPEVRPNNKRTAPEVRSPRPIPSRPTPVEIPAEANDPPDPPADDSGADAPSGDAPYALLETLCDATDRDIGLLTTREKNGQLAIAKRLIADRITADDLRGFVAYLQTMDWRTDPITMWTVEKGIGTWRASGRPAKAEPRARASPNGTQPRATPQGFARIAGVDVEGMR